LNKSNSFLNQKKIEEKHEIQQLQIPSKKSDYNNNNNNNISNLSINLDLINLNQENNLKENLNNVSYNELNNLNSQLIKKLADDNFNLNQFNIDDINIANDNFLQNNLSINKNDLKNLEYFDLLDNENDNLDFDNFGGNIYIGNVDEMDNLDDNLHDISLNKNIKNKTSEIRNTFENKDDKLFDFVLNQVQKKNMNKKTKKIKNKKLDNLLNDVSSNLTNSRIYNQEEDFGSNSIIDNSLNLHLNNYNLKDIYKNTSKEYNIYKQEEKRIQINQINVIF